MKTEFDNLRLNLAHDHEVDSNGDKQIIKIYCNRLLIAKKITLKKSIRYFGIKKFKDYLVDDF